MIQYPPPPPQRKEYPTEEGDVVPEAQAALEAWKAKRELEVEDFVAQMKMALLMAPDSLTWRELEQNIEKFKAMGLEDKVSGEEISYQLSAY